MSEDLVVDRPTPIPFLIGRGAGDRSVSRSSSNGLRDVEQGSRQSHQFLVEIRKKLPFLFIERSIVVRVVLKEGGLPVTAL